MPTASPLALLRALLVAILGVAGMIYALNGVDQLYAIAGWDVPKGHEGFCQHDGALYPVADPGSFTIDGIHRATLFPYYAGSTTADDTACWPRFSDEWAEYYGRSPWTYPVASDGTPLADVPEAAQWVAAFNAAHTDGATITRFRMPDGSFVSHPAFATPLVRLSMSSMGQFIQMGFILAAFMVFAIREALYRE